MVTNSSILLNRLDELVQQLGTSNTIADSAESVLGGASDTLDSSEALLDESEGIINTSRSRLTALAERLRGLEVQIEQNEVNLEVARNLTISAVALADQAESVGTIYENIL